MEVCALVASTPCRSGSELQRVHRWLQTCAQDLQGAPDLCVVSCLPSLCLLSSSHMFKWEASLPKTPP